MLNIMNKLNLPYIDLDSFNVVDVVRVRTTPTFGTLSKVFINDIFQCYGLEPYDRGLIYDSSTADLEKLTLYIKYEKSLALNHKLGASRYVAIPTGVYDLNLHHKNPRYKNKRAYEPFNGECPQVLNVPAYSGINIHVGNYPIDTRGCLLLGQLEDKPNGRYHLVLSTETFQKFYKKLLSFKFPTKIRYSRIYDCK